MSVFVTADLHLGHAAILRHCQRPFLSIDDMDSNFILNWNSVVGKKDIVYVIGDFAWKRHTHYLGALNGQKHLILGNHDKMNQVSLCQFSSVTPLLRVVIEKQVVVMCHYKMATWPGASYNAWHLYGHSHGTTLESPNSYCFDVGVDVWGYHPIPWGVVCKKMATKTRLASTVSVDERHLRVQRLAKENSQYGVA